MRIDVHQHVWTDELIEALRARRTVPMVRHRNGLTIVHSAGEQPYVIDRDHERAEHRSMLVRRDGLDLALIALSSPIGIEALPRDSALELIETYVDGVAALPREFAAWGPIAVDRADAAQVDDLLGRGCLGISVPAGAIAGPERLDRLGAVLERASRRGVPAFVHPGPGVGERPAEVSFGEPLWWTALTDYVVQMHAAWLTFVTFGRREHPQLDVIFAMLAGGAPLLSERLEARGGPPIELRDPRTFYETSSYGPVAIEMMAGRVGEAQLLYGSDRPVVEPAVSGREALLKANAARLFPAHAVGL